MRHSRNGIARLIYLIIFYFCYFEIFKKLVTTPNAGFYIMFLFMGLAYYLVGFLDFNNKGFNSKNVIYVSVINMSCGAVSYMFTKDIKVLIAYLIVIVTNIITKMIISSLISHRYNIMLVGEKSDLTLKIKKNILSSDSHNYIGKCSGEDIERLEEIVQERNVDQIIITEKKIVSKYTNIFLNLKLKGIKVQIDWQYNEEIEGKIDATKIDEEWLLSSIGFNILHNNLQKRVKRLFDVVLSTIILIIVLPILIIFSILVKATSKGPIFFKQKRVGMLNEEFEIIKFRSMKLHDPNKHSKYAGEKDNRITKIGNFMRKSRIDELPQLFLILKGDMSFVGPRPEWNELCNQYIDIFEKKYKIGNIYNIRHSVKPGVTGWAQVMYPYGASVEDALNKLEYDLYYIKHQSFIMDISIFFKTVKTVIFGRGR